mgnify:CR=1 FL=1
MLVNQSNYMDSFEGLQSEFQGMQRQIDDLKFNGKQTAQQQPTNLEPFYHNIN